MGAPETIAEGIEKKLSVALHAQVRIWSGERGRQVIRQYLKMVKCFKGNAWESYGQVLDEMKIERKPEFFQCSLGMLCAIGVARRRCVL